MFWKKKEEEIFKVKKKKEEGIFLSKITCKFAPKIGYTSSAGVSYLGT
jgi:hypothetical protein